MKSNDTDKKIPNDSFEKELQEEMVKVFHDLNEENEDSVDLELKKNSAKKIKYCEEGHRNVIQRRNRKYCSVGNCKSILQENEQYDAVPDTAREINSEQSPNVLTITIHLFFSFYSFTH